MRDGSIVITRKRDGATVTVRKGEALDIDPSAGEMKTRPVLQAELDASDAVIGARIYTTPLIFFQPVP